MEKIKIVICGATGRMGTRIAALAEQSGDFVVVGTVEFEGHPAVGKGEPAVSASLSSVIGLCDVVIDFTNPKASLEHLAIAVKAKKAIVIGATGLGKEEIGKITEASKHIPIVYSANMSLGVNLLFKLVKDAAKALPGFDCEIVELHHNQKKDAPSGTAVKLYQVAAEALGKDVESAGIYGRHGVIGARKKEEIGVLALRAGDIVGEHTVYFAGPGERLELTHRAHSRDVFASGALSSAKWLAGKKPGLYDMSDVLRIK